MRNYLSRNWRTVLIVVGIVAIFYNLFLDRKEAQAAIPSSTMDPELDRLAAASYTPGETERWINAEAN